MSELNEPVAMGQITEFKWKCPFEHDKSGTVENQHTAHGGRELRAGLSNGESTQIWEEKGKEIVQKKSNIIESGKCDESDCTGTSVEVSIIKGAEEEKLEYSRSAHHLIPVKASLKRSLLYDFAVKGGDNISSDIGYNVNGFENGLWLPTHHKLSSKGVKIPDPEDEDEVVTIPYRNLPDESKLVYTSAVMKQTNRQFHDAHQDYNSYVLEKLENIIVNMFIVIQQVECPKCKESLSSPDGKFPPPYPLGRRLNGLSRILKGCLLGGPLKWRYPSRLFTSSWAKEYARRSRLPH